MSTGRSAALAAAFVFVISSTASANPLNALASASPYNWAGFYVGGAVGYGWKDASAGITGNTPLLAGLITVGSIPNSLSSNPKGWLAGLQAGYNYQVNKIVLGVEADLSLADIAGRTSVTNPGPILPFATYTTSVEQRLKSFGTLRGRVGYTPVDKLLVYATGGLAFGRVDYAGNIHRSAILLNFDVPASETVTKTGWTLGGGVQYALTNKWSVKGEYLYYDLGGDTLTGLQSPKPIILVQNSASYAFVTRGSIVRLGLNFKIN